MISSVPKQSGLSSFFLALLSTCLLILAFPKSDLSPLVWFALVPWLFALDGKSPRGAFALSYWVGFGFFAGVLHWIQYVTVVGTIALVAYLALYFALFGYYYRQFAAQSVGRKVLFFPGVWIVLEFFRGHFLSGFGWGQLGHSQSQNLALIQIADITGVYGISFLIVAVNVLIKENLACVFAGGPLPQRMGLIKMNIGVLFVLLAVYGYGLMRLNEPLPSKFMRVGVIQGNIPQSEKWLEANRAATIEKYLKLSQAAMAEKPELIIWPETAFPGLISEMPQLMEEIREFSRRENVPLLLGVVTEEGNDYYNSAQLIMPDGDMSQRYDKLRLVVFGEFLPLRKQLPFLAKLIPIEDFTPGKKIKLFWLPNKDGNAYVAVPICFEDTISEVVRQFVFRGAQLVINITNDAWFEDTKEPYMHLRNAVFRTVETRRALVRSANTGVSGLIDPYGRIMKYVQNADGRKTYIDGVSVFNAPLNSTTTFYTKSGDVFTYLCFLCILWQGFFSGFLERRRREKTAS